MNNTPLDNMVKKAKEDIVSAHKSADTEDLIDRYFNEPIGYFFMRFFKKINWKPNMVTVLSMIIGFIGAICFLPNSFYHNIAGIILIMLSIILDATDGQLARLTHQTSELGRFLDGVSTFTWAAPAYIVLGIRAASTPVIPFSNGEVWGCWVFILVVLSGIFGMLLQCTMADYYRNAHLFFIDSSHSELTRSENVKKQIADLPENAIIFQKWYLAIYYVYTMVQEKLSPKFIKLLDAVTALDDIPYELRRDYLDRSKKHIQLTNVITINSRVIVLFICTLLNIPAVYFIADLFLFGIVLLITINRYEKIADETYDLHFGK